MVDLKPKALYLIEISSSVEEYAVFKNIFTNELSSDFIEQHFSEFKKLLLSVENRYYDIDDYKTLIFLTKNELDFISPFYKKMGLRTTIYNAEKVIFNNELSVLNYPIDFKEKIEQHIICSFNKDDVLDKINRGLTLTELDYQILNQ